MASGFGATEKFKVTLQNSDGSSERITVQLSLDGLKILNQEGSRTMRSYNLRNISRWDLMDTSTVIWTKTDVDLEERPLTLSSDSRTIQNVVDTLAMCCMQLAEIIQEKESEKAAASNLQELAAGGGKTKKAAKLPAVDSVDYWCNPDKAGWLQSQSEVMKLWRRRWFVLKQGYLFRFLSPDVSESVKPRGVVDLSKVQDVRDGRAVTGKANTVQLKTGSGGSSVCYVCDSETEMVEWISALDGSITKIVKTLAGIDDSDSSSSRERHSHKSSSSKERHGGGSSSSSTASEWAKQVERSMSQGHGSSSSSRHAGSSSSTMVRVVNYTGGGGGAASSSSSGYHASAPSAAAAGGYGDAYGSISDYGQVAGIAGVASAMDDLTLNYGGYQRDAAGGPSPAAAAAAAGMYGSYGASNGGYDGGGLAYGYGSSTAAYGGGGSSSTYPDASASYGYGGSGSTYSAEPAAAAANVNGCAQHQQQLPPQQQQQLAVGYGYGAADGYYQQQQQPPPQQQQQQPPYVSLLDQVPAQQPAYPYYQPTNQAPAGQEAAPPPAPAAPSSWQVHHTAEGRPYYYNTATGTTQWEAPPGM